jgi:hypothetical protein
MKKLIYITLGLIIFFHNSILFAQCAVNSPVKELKIIPKSTIPFDYYVNRIFGQIKLTYNLDCKYFYYDDSGSPNALAYQSDRNIYLGKSFLESCFARGTNVTGMYFIIAHEMSHLWQFNHREEWLKDVDGTVRHSELQADYMAGYVLAKLGYISPFNYTQLLTEVWNQGDVSWNDPSTHGTPAERIMSTHRGLTHAVEPPEAAYSASTVIAPPDRSKAGKIVGEIKLMNNVVLYIKYGGKVLNEQKRQIGQMSGIPNSFNFRISFSTDGFYDLIISPQNLVYNLQNQLIGTYQIY